MRSMLRRASIALTSRSRTTLRNFLQQTKGFIQRRRKTPLHEDLKTSSLLALPPELRNQVYAYVLRLSTRDNRIELRSLPIPPFLCTCRQIFQEAISIYFAENSFVWTIRFKHQHRLEDPIAPALEYVKENMIRRRANQPSSMGPVLDMKLDVWMPWALGGPSERDRYRFNLAIVTRPSRASNRSWTSCSMSLPENLIHVLQQWKPAGEPTFDEVFSGVVKPVWDYYKLLSCLGRRPSKKEAIWTRLADKVTKSMDDQDRSWGRW